MNYSVIESTPGYLPEDDDPPVFDQYSEAFNFLVDCRKDVEADEYNYEDEEFMIEFVDELEDGYFVYYDKRKMHDLGRIVEIVPLEEVCEECGAPDNCGDCTHERN